MVSYIQLFPTSAAAVNDSALSVKPLVRTTSENEYSFRVDACTKVVSTTTECRLCIIQSAYELTSSVFLTVKVIHRVFKTLILLTFMGCVIIEWE